MKKFNKNAWNFYGAGVSAAKGNVVANIRNGNDSRNVVMADHDSFASFFGKCGIINNAERVLKGLDNVYAYKVSELGDVIEVWFVNEYNEEHYVKWNLINLNVKDAYVRWIESNYVSKAFGSCVDVFAEAENNLKYA